MIVWIVNISRFVQEYHNHVLDVELKHINWMIDIKTGFLKMYITATHGSEMYCHIHETGIGTLPIAIKDKITKEGMVLGTMGFSEVKGVEDGINELVREFKGLKFNQVTPK